MASKWAPLHQVTPIKSIFYLLFQEPGRWGSPGEIGPQGFMGSKGDPGRNGMDGPRVRNPDCD